MKLGELLSMYIKESAELDKEKSNCDHSWGYYLHDQIEELDKTGVLIETLIV